MTRIAAQAVQGESDSRRARILSLAESLIGQDYQPNVSPDEPLLSIPRRHDIPLFVRCDPRASDGGRLWFYAPPGHAIEQADDTHMMNAIVAIKQLAGEPVRM